VKYSAIFFDLAAGLVVIVFNFVETVQHEFFLKHERCNLIGLGDSRLKLLNKTIHRSQLTTEYLCALLRHISVINLNLL